MSILDPKPPTRAELTATYATPATVTAAVAPKLDKAEAATLYTPASGQNLSPALFRKWRKALAGVRAGTAQAKILAVGDSTTDGYLATRQTSYPATLVKALSGYFPTSVGLAAPTTTTDTRWTTGSGWVFGTSFGWANGCTYVADTTATGTLTFTPGINCDTFDVWLWHGNGWGTTTISVDGGAATSVNCATGGVGWIKTTVTATAGSNHVVTLTAPTGAAVMTIGIDAYLSTTKTVRIGNAGRSGSTTANWTDSQASTGSVDCIKAYAPDLTLIMLGINDAGASVSVATWQANLTKTINAAKISGDVILMSVVPSSTAAITLESAYRDAAPALAASLGVGYVDIFGRFQSYAVANADGLMADGLHPNALGYADIAQAVGKAIAAI